MKMPDTLEERAEIIAAIIDGTGTKYRGDLLLLVGKTLEKGAQHFTGSLFIEAAREYGTNQPDNG